MNTCCPPDPHCPQGEAEGKMCACEKQLLACKERVSALTAEVEAERQRAAKVRWELGRGLAVAGESSYGGLCC